jgi:transcriptional regulator with XRE-family HTH domain
MAKTDIKKHFGMTVKKLRLQAGLTQEEFARRCCLHRSYISGVENGARNISLESVEKLAVALGVSQLSLFSGESKIKKNAES